MAVERPRRFRRGAALRLLLAPNAARPGFDALRMMPAVDSKAMPVSRLRALVHDRSGSTILEFAILAPILFALILATIETSLVFFTQQVIDTATEVAARKVMTGAAQSGRMTQEEFRKSACTSLPAFLSCSKLMIDVQTALTFSNASTDAPTLTYDKDGNVTNNFNYATGGAGDIVVMRLMYLWPVPTGPLGFDLSNQSDGQRLLIGTSVAKTEPYK